MSRRVLRLALAVFCFAAPLRAADDEPWAGPAFSAPAAAVLEAVRRLPSPGDDAIEVLALEVTYKFDEGGRYRVTTHRIYRVLSQQGVDQWGTLSAAWQPALENRPALRARVISADGSVYELDPKAIGDGPLAQSPHIVSDDKLARAPLPAVSVGAVAETEIVQNRRSPAGTDVGVVSWFPLAYPYPVRKMRLVVDAPAAATLRYDVTFSNLQPVRTEPPGRTVLTCENRAAVPAARPGDVPSRLAFSTGKSWHDVASAFAAIVEPTMDPTAVASLVRQELDGQTNQVQIVARLLRAVHRLIRYEAVCFGDSAIVPRRPQEVLARRYGDCKDQAVLLASMLRAAGLQAEVALLNTPAAHNPLMPRLPGVNCFDHMIVFVPGRPPLWIDPSADAVPAGQLPLGDQRRLALVISSETTSLVEIPAADYRENARSDSYVFDFSDAAAGRLDVTISAKGVLAQRLRAATALTGESEWRKVADNLVRLHHGHGSAQVEVPSTQEPADPFEVRMKIGGAALDRALGGILVLPLRPAGMWADAPLLLTPGDRDLALGQNLSPLGRALLRIPQILPHAHEMAYQVTVPTGYEPIVLLPAVDKQAGPFRIRRECSWNSNGTLALTFRFETGNDAFGPADVEALRKAARELTSGADISQWEVKLAFRPKAGASPQDPAQRLAEARRLVRQHPDEARFHSSYAQALVAAGFGQAAREEARRGVALAPGSAAAQAILGQVLCQDLLGRPWRPGMDRAGACAAFRASLALNPADTIVRISYGLALECDSGGWRYSPGASPQEAIQQYQLVRQQGVNTDKLNYLLGLALFHRGRYAEALRIAALPTADLRLLALRLAATVVTQDAAAAQDEALRSIERPEQRNQACVMAGMILEAASRYQAVLDFGQRIVPSLPDPRAMRAEVDRATRMQQACAARPADSDPRNVVRQIVADFPKLADDRRALDTWFCAEAAAEDIDEHLRFLGRRMRLTLDAARAAEMPRQRWVDGVWAMSLSLEGSDATGYRTMTDFGGPDQRYVWLLVREKNAYRVVPMGNFGSVFGLVALRQLEEQNAAGARRWLDHACLGVAAKNSGKGPFGGSPLSYLWRPAQHDDPAQIRLCAAAAVAAGLHPQRAIPLLVEARQSNTDDLQRLQIDRALQRAYRTTGQLAEMAAVNARILEKYPQAAEPIADKALVLWMQQQPEAARSWLQEQRTAAADKTLADRLAVDGRRFGDFAAAEEVLRRTIDRGTSSAAVLNMAAWNEVLLDAVDQRTLDTALKANEVAQYDNFNCLHTLATVYAELGRMREALETLRRLVSLRCDQPEPGDWYVLGRIAEKWQLPEVAAALYRIVTPATPAAADDVYSLAQRRLQAH